MPTAPPNNRPELVSVVETARLLGCHQQTVYKRLRDGSLPIRHVRIGRKLGLLRTDLDLFVGRSTAQLPPGESR